MTERDSGVDGNGSPERAVEDPTPAARGVWTGGTLAGEDVAGGSVLRPDKDEILSDDQGLYGGPDLLGEHVVDDPALAGTVAGNTTGAAEILRRPRDEPDTVEEDLGPEDAVVQELGGEARC